MSNKQKIITLNSRAIIKNKKLSIEEALLNTIREIDMKLDKHFAATNNNILDHEKTIKNENINKQ